MAEKLVHFEYNDDGAYKVAGAPENKKGGSSLSWNRPRLGFRVGEENS